MNIIDELHESLEDEHLECMIRLACKRRSAQEIQDLLNEMANEPDEEEELIEAESFALFEQKLKAAERTEKKRRCRNRMRRAWPRFLQAAACLLLVFAIAAPISLANSPALRNKIIQLLSGMNDDHANVRLQGTEIEVPEGWAGTHYPTYMPEGYELKYISSDQRLMIYDNSRGSSIQYIERGGKLQFNVDDERTDLIYTSVQGMQAAILDQENETYVMWSDGKQTFSVYSDLSKEELLRIAESVRAIE